MGWTTPSTWVAAAKLYAAELNEQVKDNLNFLKANIALEAAVELTISSGSVTKTKAFHTIDTESDAATDDLATIAGGTEGDIIVLRAENAARVVTVTTGAAAGNIACGTNIVLSTTENLALMRGPTTWHVISAAHRTRTFMVNSFQYPASGTDWTPQLVGAGLAQSLSAKKVWMPLNFLKIGDAIVSYNLVGDATEAAALTLDCKLVRINKADPLTTTDVAGGGITQITANGNFDSLATLTAPETIATDKQYSLEILGTTGAGDSIIVMGAEVVIRWLP